MKHPSRRRPSRAGQALVETALVLPIFLVCLLGVVDMGRAVWATASLAAAAREAARYAIVHGGTAGNTCPVGPHGPDVRMPVAITPSCPHPSDEKQSITDAATTAAIAGGTAFIVTACYGSGCTGNADTTNNARGQPVTVVVTSNVQLIVPSLLGQSSFNISGSSTMIVNH